MAKLVDARTLKSWLHQPGELALLDMREAGRFGESHLLYAVPVPYSRLELDIGRLVPRSRPASCYAMAARMVWPRWRRAG